MVEYAEKFIVKWLSTCNFNGFDTQKAPLYNLHNADYDYMWSMQTIFV